MKTGSLSLEVIDGEKSDSEFRKKKNSLDISFNATVKKWKKNDLGTNLGELKTAETEVNMGIWHVCVDWSAQSFAF